MGNVDVYVSVVGWGDLIILGECFGRGEVLFWVVGWWFV